MTEPPSYPNASFRLTGPLAAHVLSRAADGRVSAGAKRDLGRYYETLARNLASVPFTDAEAMLILDVCNGTRWDAWSAPLLWANVSDALEDGYAQKWQVDGPALVARLRALTPGQCMAVVDAVERWWNLDGDVRNDWSVSLPAVGLTRPQERTP